jgi:hypothetical protein
MPEGYEKIKESLRKRHPDWSEKKIKTVAAKIWNSQHPNDPVHPGRK